MDDSHFSHSACQVVPAIEAESLKHQDQERILPCKSRMEKSNPFLNKTQDISKTKGLFPMEPLKINEGMISSCSEISACKEFQPLQFKEQNFVVQETKLGAKPATAATKQAKIPEVMATEEIMAMEEERRR